MVSFIYGPLLFCYGFFYYLGVVMRNLLAYFLDYSSLASLVKTWTMFEFKL